MHQFVIFNSQTSGNVHTETIAGREHLVTSMVSLVGNTVMKNILYPLEEVQNALPQLDMLPAPAGHPKINGVHVSAAHPVAMNAFNIGGFIRNPRMENAKVVNDFCLDTQVANQTDEGKELIRRMNAHEAVGVSTGLNLQVENASGIGGDGVAYEKVGRNFQFDHVAVLLNEAAAGEHVGTAMQYNNLDVIMNELSSDSLTSQLDTLIDKESGDDHSTWVMDTFPDSKQFIYRSRPPGGETGLFKRSYSVGPGDVVALLDDAVEVVKKVTFVPIGGSPALNVETPKMDTENEDGAVAENEDGGSEDNATEASSAANDAGDMTHNDLLAQAAKKGLTLVTNDQAEDLAAYRKNKPAIDSMVARHTAELDEKRKAVAENLGMTEEEGATLTEAVINSQYAKLTPAQNYALNAGGVAPAANGENGESFFIPNDAYDNKEGESDDARK